MNPLPPWMAAAGAELHGRFGDELRAEAESSEREAARLRLALRSQRDVLTEAMHRGHRVRVLLASGPVEGRLRHVGDDIATLEVADGPRMHLNLATTPAFAVLASDRGGRGTSGAPDGEESLRALLRRAAIEAARVSIELTTGSPTGLAGRVCALATDHVLLQFDDGEWSIPLGRIAAVFV